MTRVDQFESVFRSAARAVYRHEPVELESVLVVSDRPPEEAGAFGSRIRSFLDVLGRRENLRWRVVGGDDFDSVPDLLALVEQEHPGLICTYRHLHSESWRWPYTLGEYVDVLTQAIATPVLVVPHPDSARAAPFAMADTSRVMAVTDHLEGDHRLVSYAARFTPDDGTLYLTHVEDGRAFGRYMDAVSKIPSIDTENAREEILDRLLKDPADYIGSCREVLGRVRPGLGIEAVVRVGYHLEEYRTMIEEHEVDLLVLNTKDHDQLAMHGLAYPLAIELRRIPLLML